MLRVLSTETHREQHEACEDSDANSFDSKDADSVRSCRIWQSISPRSYSFARVRASSSRDTEYPSQTALLEILWSDPQERMHIEPKDFESVFPYPLTQRSDLILSPVKCSPHILVHVIVHTLTVASTSDRVWCLNRNDSCHLSGSWIDALSTVRVRKRKIPILTRHLTCLYMTQIRIVSKRKVLVKTFSKFRDRKT